MQDWKTAHGGIQLIEFDKTSSLQDKYLALGCITVLTSNQVVGTLTHIDTEVIIDDFIKHLNVVLQDNKDNSLVILSGGSGRPESRKKEEELTKKLEASGYTIVAKSISHSLAPAGQLVTLHRDKVVISQMKATNKLKNSITELTFSLPSVEKSYEVSRSIPQRSQSDTSVSKMRKPDDDKHRGLKIKTDTKSIVSTKKQRKSLSSRATTSFSALLTSPDAEEKTPTIELDTPKTSDDEKKLMTEKSPNLFSSKNKDKNITISSFRKRKGREGK